MARMQDLTEGKQLHFVLSSAYFTDGEHTELRPRSDIDCKYFIDTGNFIAVSHTWLGDGIYDVNMVKFKKIQETLARGKYDGVVIDCCCCPGDKHSKDLFMNFLNAGYKSNDALILNLTGDYFKRTWCL